MVVVVPTNDLWTYTSEYRWLREYLEIQKWQAISEMATQRDVIRYAELRGFIEAIELVIKAPEQYTKAMEAREHVQEISRSE